MVTLYCLPNSLKLVIEVVCHDLSSYHVFVVSASVHPTSTHPDIILTFPRRLGRLYPIIRARA